MNIINSQDWDNLSKEFASGYFPSICIDDFLIDDFAVEIAESYPNYMEAQSHGREFSKVNEKGKVQITNPALFPDPVKQLASALASESFIKNLQTLSGIPDLEWDPNFSGGGMHLTGSSGHLDVHVDFNFAESIHMHRRLNLLLYLNQQWMESWGGELELWDEKVKNCFKVVSPAINRCVIFETSEISFHGVRAVTCPADVTRNSFAVYYYTKHPPPNWDGTNHSTIFKARPDEKAKKYIHMPAEAVKESYVFEKLRGLKRRALSLSRKRN